MRFRRPAGRTPLRAALIASQPHELDGVHVERVRQARQRLPGRILRAALYARHRNRMQVGLARERFDAQSAFLAKAADRGSDLGKGRLRHGRKPASRYRGYKAITYMLVSRFHRKAPGEPREAGMSARIEAASDAGTAALDLSAPCKRLGPSRDTASTRLTRNWGRQACPGRFASHERPGHLPLEGA